MLNINVIFERLYLIFFTKINLENKKKISAANLWCLGVGLSERKLGHCVLLIPLKVLLGFWSLFSLFWLLACHEVINFFTMPFQYDVLPQKKHSKCPMN